MPKIPMDDGVGLHYLVDDFGDPWICDPGQTILMLHGNVKTLEW